MKPNRVLEVYEGTAGSREGQRRTRMRVHWTCRQAQGRVLDVGCSQGLTALLLAREGREVVGVDVQEASIAFAQRRLEDEEPAVRERVTFLVAEGRSLPFEDDAFDTVVMGELLEHLIDPGPVLDEARRVLRPGGRLVLTTPYGLFPSLDHKDPIYLLDLVEMLRGRFAVRGIELLDRLLGVVAVADDAGREPDAALWRRALEVAEQRLRAQDETAEELRAKAKTRPKKAEPRAPREGANGAAAKPGSVLRRLPGFGRSR